MDSKPRCYSKAGGRRAQGTHFIYVEGPDLFQHNFANLDTTGRFSRPVSVHFDFTELSELGHRYNTEFLNGPKGAAPDLDALAALLDRIFELNSMSLAAAEAFHACASVGMTSIDYDAPALTKYDRLAHDKAGNPKVEICYALLHYEKAIKEFNEVKAHSAAGTMDLTLLSGTYCVVAVAACIEAIANNLVYLQTGEHSNPKNPHTPLEKINVAAEHLIAQSGGTYQPLRKGQDIFDVLDTVRVLRNGFMHAKELQTDIDPDTRTSTTLTQVDEVACRNYLKRLRQAVDNVYGQLPHLAPPIVVRANMTWMGELEVP